MICERCGTQSDNGARICPHCGAPLTKDASSADGVAALRQGRSHEPPPVYGSRMDRQPRASRYGQDAGRPENHRGVPMPEEAGDRRRVHSRDLQPRKVMRRGVNRALLLTVLAVASVVIMALSLPTPGHQEWTYGMAKVLAGAMIIPLYLCIGKWVAGRLGRKTVVELVVVNGTVYLAMQNYFIGFIRNVIIHFWGHEAISQMFWWRPAIALVVMVAILPFAWLIHYHAPWMLGKGRLFEKETH